MYHFVSQDVISSNSLLIIGIYALLPFKYIISYGKVMNLVFDINVQCYRLFNLIDGNLYITQIFGNIYNKKCKGMIEFEKVNFEHNGKLILENYSFKINTNKMVVLYNEDIKKKNAILDLISRLYNADSGVVKIDGIDITEYSEEYIRDNIGMVSKMPFLFDVSIKENFRLVKYDITDEEIVDVCKKVRLDKDISLLPYKYDTIISENDGKINGFFRQRMALARLLIRDVKILLLDDCNYDSIEFYDELIKIIKQIKNKYTIIVVSNNDIVLKECDKILYLDMEKSK